MQPSSPLEPGLFDEQTVADAEHARGPETAVGPGFDTDQLIAAGQRYLLGNYRQAPVVLVKGEGVHVTDTTGKRYLDFAAGVAVNALGHAHPRLVRTIADQAARLMHVSNYFYNAENVLLAKELCERTGYDRAFFCNSGAEANEAMFKLARRHFYAKGQKEKYRFIAFDNAFHGRTLATVSLTGTPSYKEGFGPKLEGITHVPYGDLEAVRAAPALEAVSHSGRNIGGAVVGGAGLVSDFQHVAVFHHGIERADLAVHGHQQFAAYHERRQGIHEVGIAFDE